MGLSNIEWTDFTWNPWRGCEEVSPGCSNCYARQFARRSPEVLGEWGHGTNRVVAKPTYWIEPSKWNRKAFRDGVRRRVFLGSMMDIFEDRGDLHEPRSRAQRVISECHNLDFLLLTKRAQNIKRLWEDCRTFDVGIPGLQDTKHWPYFPNAWFGCTVEDQKRAEERIPLLLSVPAQLRFLSVEPLLEPVNLSSWLLDGGIHWVIVGGESMQGGRCRPCDIEWIEEVVWQCQVAKVPVFVKQLGSQIRMGGPLLRIGRKGDDMADFPDHLKVRQFPLSPAAPRENVT